MRDAKAKDVADADLEPRIAARHDVIVAAVLQAVEDGARTGAEVEAELVRAGIFDDSERLALLRRHRIGTALGRLTNVGAITRSDAGIYAVAARGETARG